MKVKMKKQGREKKKIKGRKEIKGEEEPCLKREKNK